MNTLETSLPHGVKFAEKWVEWIQYKKEIKDSYKSPKSATGKAKQLGQYTESAAINMIDQSISNGWKGIFPLVKNGLEPETGNLVYKTPNPPTLSNYKPEKPFERSEFIAKLRDKIKGYYNSGKIINDFGGAVTSFLVKQCQMSVPEDIKQDIERDCIQEKERDRTRFEEQYQGTVEGDTRDLCLKWWLNDCKDKKRELLKEI